MKRFLLLLSCLLFSVFAVGQTFNTQLNSPGYLIKGVRFQNFVSLPVGSAATAPAMVTAAGAMRYNDVKAQVEYWSGTAWLPFATVDSSLYHVQLVADQGLHIAGDTVRLGGIVSQDTTRLLLDGDLMEIRQRGDDSVGLYFYKAADGDPEKIRLYANDSLGAESTLDFAKQYYNLRISDAAQVALTTTAQTPDDVSLEANGVYQYNGLYVDTATASIGGKKGTGVVRSFYINASADSVWAGTDHASSVFAISREGALRLENYKNNAAGDSVLSTDENGLVKMVQIAAGGVTSVNGKTGAVVLTTDDVSEGSNNQYFTTGRARSSVSATTPLQYNASTGVLSHISSGVSPGTYNSVTVNATGHVTAGTNTSPSAITADNALTKTSNNIQLGGALTKNTSVYGNNSYWMNLYPSFLNVGNGDGNTGAKMTVRVDTTTATSSDISVALAAYANLTDPNTGLSVGLNGLYGVTSLKLTQDAPATDDYTYVAGVLGLLDIAKADDVYSLNSTVSPVAGISSVLRSTGGTANISDFAWFSGGYNVIDPHDPVYSGQLDTVYGFWLRDIYDGSLMSNIKRAYGIYIKGSAVNNYFAGHTGFGINTSTSAVDVNGTATDGGADLLRVRKSFTPTGTSDAAGETGSWAWDDDYFYVKTSEGWKRVALTAVP